MLAGSCVLCGRWQALSTRHKGLAQKQALVLNDRVIEILCEMQADVMVSSTHRKQYASRIFKKSLCVQTRSGPHLKNASAQLLCNSLRARPGFSPSARHAEVGLPLVFWGATFTSASKESKRKIRQGDTVSKYVSPS